MEASFIRIGVTAPLATIEESDTDTDGSSESDVEEEEDGVHNVDQVDGPEVEDKKEGCKENKSVGGNLGGRLPGFWS